MKFSAQTFTKSLSKIAGFLRYKHLFLIAVIVFLVMWKAFWSPDVLFLVFLTIFLIYGHAKEYIRKFAPFVILLMSYESLRGLAPIISPRVHFTEMINFDKWLA